jgi:hypothetical protein
MMLPLLGRVRDCLGWVLCDTGSECFAAQALSCRPLDRYDPSVSVKRGPTVELIGAARMAARCSTVRVDQIWDVVGASGGEG